MDRRNGVNMADERLREEKTAAQPRVGVIMGSDSDWSVMEDAAHALAEFDVPFEVGVVSAHRTPDRMLDYARTAAGRGIEVIIAGAGGAAHLPGMVASATPLPVIGVPVPLAKLDGLDSLLSIVQMPAGVPVATVSIGGARNAGLLAVRILGSSDAALRKRIEEFQAGLEDMVLQKDSALRNRLLGPQGTVAGE
jgi:5-(carboxyamino)imidazole ribonucleotide mutase